MKRIFPTRRFSRDLKRMKKRGADLREMEDIIDQLAADQDLPLRCRPHKLVGGWTGMWECHIRPDWLLVYDLDDPDALTLVATGSHADLFR